MSEWIQAMNPKGPIATEADALRAGRASAVAILIGVVTGVISLVWTIMHPAALQAAVAQAGADSAQAADVAATGAQIGLWLAGALIAIQLVFAFIQWRDPKKWIAILFLVLIAYGVVSTLATPILAGSMPNIPVVPMWQIVLSLVVLAIEAILHVAGLRGIRRLEAMQFEAAR